MLESSCSPNRRGAFALSNFMFARLFRFILCLVFLLPGMRLHAVLELPDLFATNMVLQREQRVPVWGRADPGSRVTLEFAGQHQTAVTDAEGRWRVHLDPMQASTEPRSMILTSTPQNERRTLENVLVGDVWLCSGQSNMAMTVDGPSKWLYIGGVADAKEVVRTSQNALLRQFYVDWKTSTQPQETCSGSWTVAGPETTAQFSATGYFFARELQKRLGIPVAILSVSWGGSSVESWISPQTQTAECTPDLVSRMKQIFHDHDHYDELVSAFASEFGAWEKRNARTAPAPPAGLEEPVAGAAPSHLVHLPAPVSKLGCPDGGVVWITRDFEIPEAWGSAWRLDFPACKAFSAIYVNGVKIFEANPTNDFSIRASRPTLPPKVAKPGARNTIAIRLHAHTGAAGVTGGPFAIIPFNPKFNPIPMSGEWNAVVEKVFEPLASNAGEPPKFPTKPVLHWLGVPAMYNAMLHPIIPFGIRGVAWYQGESNVGNALYRKHLQMLVRDWRRLWGQGDFPFLACQLPGYGARSLVPSESRWADCREAQAGVLELPNTGLVNLIDTSEDGDLHPIGKQEVGARLARLALAKVYGARDTAGAGPVFDSVVMDGDKAIVKFRDTGAGLVARELPAFYRPNLRKPELPQKPLELPSPESTVQGFTLCEMRPQADGSLAPHWEFANARIEGDRVIVWSPYIRNPQAVRYAWGDHPVCNLASAEGLPAFPFRSDRPPAPPSKAP